MGGSSYTIGAGILTVILGAAAFAVSFLLHLPVAIFGASFVVLLGGFVVMIVGGTRRRQAEGW
jgi:undecaprenyl pyrophosphate phosphatase UppP